MAGRTCNSDTPIRVGVDFQPYGTHGKRVPHHRASLWAALGCGVSLCKERELCGIRGKGRALAAEGAGRV